MLLKLSYQRFIKESDLLHNKVKKNRRDYDEDENHSNTTKQRRSLSQHLLLKKCQLNDISEIEDDLYR